MVKGREVNPHAKEAWKVTKSSVKGEVEATHASQRLEMKYTLNVF